MLSELKEHYSCDVEEMFTEAFAILLVGRMFYFGIKLTELFKNDKNMKVTIKELRNCNENSMKHISNTSGLIALQMIPACEEDSTKPATVVSVLKELLHQETEDLSMAQVQEISTVGKRNENSEVSDKHEYQTIDDHCVDCGELSSYNQTDLILSCESVHKSLTKESDHSSSLQKKTNSSSSCLCNKTRHHSFESADGLSVANVDHNHQSDEYNLCLEDCSMSELHQPDLSQLPEQEIEKNTSRFSAYGMSVLPSSGCCMLSEQGNYSPTLNKTGSFNIKRMYASLSDRSLLPETSAPYSEDLDVFLQDLENELVFHETSVIPDISQQQVITVGSSAIATLNPCTSSHSTSQLDTDSQNVTVKRSLDDCLSKRSLDYIVKGCNISVMSSQSTEKGYTECLQHFQHDEFEQEKCSLAVSTLCVSDKSCDLFDGSTDLFVDCSNWSSSVASKEHLRVNRLQQSMYRSLCINSPVLRAVSKTRSNQNKFQTVNRKSLHSPSVDVFTISLGDKGNSDMSPLPTATLQRSGMQRRLSKDVIPEVAVKSTVNTLLHPISSTPKVNYFGTSKPVENLHEPLTIIQSSSSLIRSQDLFDHSSSPVDDYTDSSLSLSLPMSHNNHETVPLPWNVIITGQKHNLSNVSLKHSTQMKMQEASPYAVNSSRSSSSLDRCESCDYSEDLFSQDASEQSAISEIMLTSSYYSDNVNCLSQNTNCSKDLFDDS